MTNNLEGLRRLFYGWMVGMVIAALLIIAFDISLKVGAIIVLGFGLAGGLLLGYSRR